MWPRQFDENNNNCPQIYHHILQNPRNPLEQYYGPILREGLRYIDISAYLKTIDNLHLKHQCHALEINKTMCSRSSLVETHPSFGRNSSNHDIVFVWDINEITMLQENCLEEVHIVCERMPQYINALTILRALILMDSKFDPQDDIEMGSFMNIEDAFNSQTDELKQFIPKYEGLKLFYNSVLRNDKDNKASISRDLLERFGFLSVEKFLDMAAESHQKIFHNRWKYARRCLKLANKRSSTTQNKKYANVVITEGPLYSAATQLILSDTSRHVPIENIYSTTNSSEEIVLNRIQERFGRKCVLVQVSSRSINHNLSVVWQVYANESIKYLYKFQRDNMFN